MILLDGHSLKQDRRIVPEALEITLTERDSTAAMTPDSMAGISTKSWFLDNTNPGKGIVWRVRSIENDFANETPRVQLEHIINTLKDRILFGEVTPATITGAEGAETCSALQAVQYILARQSDWVLGNFGYAVSNPYKFDGNNLYDALETVTRSLKDAWWSYDLTTYPFKLNITPRPADVTCELRAGRNLQSVVRTLNTSNMYTRFYPIGKDDLHIPGNYVSRNEAAYGIIEHVEVNSGLETEAELIRWANERLDVHAQPADSIEIDGLELTDATGEPMDRLTIGRMCRVPLPEYGTTITERITRIRYADKIKAPEVAQITLANAQEDLVKMLADIVKEGAGPGGAGGRGAARQDKEDHAWFEDTDTHVAMVAEGIVGRDKDGNPDWARLSKIIVDGEGIHQSVTVMKDDIQTLGSAVEQNEVMIKSEVTMRTKQGQELTSKITQTAAQIRSEVSNSISGVSSRITQVANRVSIVVDDKNNVKKASIVAAINSGQSSVKISADKIDLNGYVTASELNATNATISSLISGSTTFTSVNTQSIRLAGYSLFLGSVTIDGRSYNVVRYGTGD